jgi:AraC family transcriptional activator of pobA
MSGLIFVGMVSLLFILQIIYIANFRTNSLPVLIQFTVCPTIFTDMAFVMVIARKEYFKFVSESQKNMEQIVKLDSVATYNKLRGTATLHPLITVIDLSKAEPMEAKTFNFGLYAVYLKELNCGELKYGRNTYDYQEGTLVFTAPGQVIGIQPNVKTFEAKGWALLFHPDLIKGTALGRHIQDYSFFSYDVNEALHLSEKERQIVLDCFAKIEYELQQSIDKHSKTLIVTNIELFLNYCTRFYDRQFITRDIAHQGTLEKFEELLNGYFSSDKPQSIGLPSVAYCADELNLSANYFGDLIKKETGKSATEYIHEKVIDVAKERIFNVDKSISEVAYELGFKYPQHFTRAFKQRVGVAPNEYRRLN